jgi:predicted ATP-grasp superfamily ATP-dependent carboligase
MLELLRSDASTFAVVQTVPGAINLSASAYHGRGVTAVNQMDVEQKLAQEHAARMRRYARENGADYLFLFGGTIDHATTGTPLSLADLTIVGAFIVPSKRISADARAGGTLIDVHSGRVVLNVSAQDMRTSLTPTAARETGQVKLMSAMRDDLCQKLAEQLKERMRAVASTAAGRA